MAKVGIVMGSDSDMPVMAQAADFLEKMGIEFEMTVISAHLSLIHIFWSKHPFDYDTKVEKVFLEGQDMTI